MCKHEVYQSTNPSYTRSLKDVDAFGAICSVDGNATIEPGNVHHQTEMREHFGTGLLYIKNKNSNSRSSQIECFYIKVSFAKRVSHRILKNVFEIQLEGAVRNDLVVAFLYVSIHWIR